MGVDELGVIDRRLDRVDVRPGELALPGRSRVNPTEQAPAASWRQCPHQASQPDIDPGHGEPSGRPREDHVIHPGHHSTDQIDHLMI